MNENDNSTVRTVPKDVRAIVWTLTGILALQYLDRQIISGAGSSIKVNLLVFRSNDSFIRVKSMGLEFQT